MTVQGYVYKSTKKNQALGGGNSSAKPVVLDGKLYSCVKKAMSATGLSRYKVLQLGSFK